MSSDAENVPSCSKMNAISTEELIVGDTIINKFPVVVLTKLDLDTISVKVNPEDVKFFEKQQASTASSKRKATKTSEAKKGSWSDDDATLSDVSVSVSDIEEPVGESPRTRKNYQKSGQEDTDEEWSLPNDESAVEGENQVSADISKKRNETGSRSTGRKMNARPQSRISRQKALKQSKDSPSIKKPKADDTVEIVTHPVQTMKSPAEKKYNKNARYKLYLSPFTESALESEAFRKFINLAADCVVSFSKKKTAAGSMSGNVELFFGDYLTLEQAMQRLIQLRVFGDKSVVRGSITCLEIKPAKVNSKDQWKASFSAKLFFQLNTEKREKLQQLISTKGRKKEDTTKKCVQLNRIPSSVNEEMLSLLFPFSVGVNISETGSSDKDWKGPVEVEFENQEWLDGVLACFRDFGVSTNKAHDKVYSLDVGNTTLAKGKPQEKSAVTKFNERRRLVPGSFIRGGLRGRFPGRILSNTRTMFARGSVPLNQRIALERNDQRKRVYPGAGFGSRVLGNKSLPVKRSRLEIASRDMARAGRGRNDPQSQHAVQADSDNNAVRQIALSRGLDPNNPDVIKVLEMTAQLEKLQTIAMHQRAEATSLGFVGLPSQQVVAEHQLQAKQQAIALKQEAEARRYQTAVRSRVLEGVEQPGRSWPPGDKRLQRLEIARRREEEERIARRREEEERIARREEEDRRRREEEERIARRIEEEERMKQEEYQRQEMIARRRKQVQELELLPRHREGQRTHPKIVSSYGREAVDLADTSPILPYGHAPPTSGLLGAAPVPARDKAGVDGRERRPRQHDEVPIGGSPTQIGRLRSPQTKPAFNRRAQDSRKDIPERKFSGRHSRWTTEREMDYDPNTADQFQADPDRNDDPLDFNRPQSKLTTEQAFRQDIERTRAALHIDTVTGRSFRPKPLVQTRRPLMEEARDRHALPVQFGKNAAKKVPKEISHGRRSIEINQNTRNARNLDNTDAYNSFPGASGNRWESGPTNNRGGAVSEELGGRFKGIHRGSGEGLLEIPRGAIDERGRLLPRGQNRAAEQNNGFDAQHRSGIQNQNRGRGMALKREHDSVREDSWKAPRLRQGYSEHDQESQDFYPDDNAAYQKQNPEGRFGERAGGYRGAQYSDQTEDVTTGPQLYERGPPGSAARRSYAAREVQSFTREEEGLAGYEESGNYTSETSYDVFQARGVPGAGRGSSVSQARGSRGRMGANKREGSAQGRGDLAKRNVPAHGRGRQMSDGRGLLEVPEQFKHLETSYFGEASHESHEEDAGGDHDHFQQFQNKGRERRMHPNMPPPPMPPPLLGHRPGVNFY